MFAARFLPLPLVLLACAPHEPARIEGEAPPPTRECFADMRRVEGGDEVAAFCMDTFEVTTAQYHECVAAGVCTIASAGTGESCSYFDPPGAYPINCVEFEQAERYCRWRGKRVPSDAEWLWAAHGGARRTAYPWGDEPGPLGGCVGRSDEQGWCVVGSFDDASPEGLRDLVGNVSEWTQLAGVGGLRGGSWRYSAEQRPEGWRATEGSAGSGIRCAANVGSGSAAIWGRVTEGPQPEPLEALGLPPMPPLAPVRPLAHLDVVGFDVLAAPRWSELADGRFVPFAGAEPSLSGLPAPFDVSTLAEPLADCRPLRGLRDRIVLHCEEYRRGPHLVAIASDGGQVRWSFPYRGHAPDEDVWIGESTLVVATSEPGTRPPDSAREGSGELFGHSLVTGRAVWRHSLGWYDRWWYDDTGVYLLRVAPRAPGQGMPRPRYDRNWRQQFSEDELSGSWAQEELLDVEQFTATLQAVDSETGAVTWERPVSCGPVRGDGLVLEDADGFHRVDPRTGAVTAKLGPPRASCEAMIWRQCVPVIAGGRLFVHDECDTGHGGLRVFDLASGRLLWRREARYCTGFAVDGDAVYAVEGRDLLARDAATGELQQSITLDPSYRVPRVLAVGGEWGPLVVVRGASQAVAFGRAARPGKFEEYTVRGRIVVRGGPWRPGSVSVGPQSVDVEEDGRFTASGRGSRGMRLDVVVDESDLFARTRSPVHLTRVVLDGRKDYPLAPIVITLEE